MSIAEQGQFTDRFTKAVEQLDWTGPEHLQARLGGIYALERLARDSPRDQPTIIEVLSAFVRTTTRPTHSGGGAANVAPISCPHDENRPDILAAVVVLGRRDSAHDSGTPIDLHGACLRGSQLGGVDLAGANLRDADLSGADLSDSDLLAADLSGADLSGAKLSRVNRSISSLRGTLTDTRTQNDELRRSQVADALRLIAEVCRPRRDKISTLASLSSDLFVLDPRSTSDRDEQLRIASRYVAEACGTDFRGAKLAGANLEGMDLSGSDLVQADLRNARHDDATKVDGAKTDSTTQGIWW